MQIQLTSARFVMKVLMSVTGLMVSYFKFVNVNFFSKHLACNPSLWDSLQRVKCQINNQNTVGGSGTLNSLACWDGFVDMTTTGW